MNSQDKRHGSYRGSMQGYCRYGEGFGDGSGYMDETDREVSNLTDRAFRSLCIGEEAVYNDSSPVERHKAFADDAPNEEAAGTSGIGPTFQRSVADVAKQERAFAARTVSHHSNGVIETTWQQKRSSSKVSSLVRAFSAGYEENVAVTTDAAVMSQDSMYKQDSESWEGSALLSIQKELSEFSSVYHQSIKGGPYPQTRNLFGSSEAAVAPQIPSNTESSAPSPTFMKSSSSSKCSGKVKKPSSRNFFLHSEFSPFQTWKEYNRHLYDREVMPDVPPTSQSPRWYDSPFYKELTVAHRNQMAQLEEKQSHRRQYENPLPAEPPASTVRQKASAVEKRSESEVTLSCPPWRRSQEPVKNKVPQNRPCTASPVSDRSRRKEEGLVPTGRTSATNQKVQMLADDQTSNSGTPFSISQLLTPMIHPRQETETSEILQYALSPNILDPQLPSETDPRTTPEVKPRNKYKAMASSLLFNLKDNRKRVKSTYTPTMFKSVEIPDHSKQPSQLDSLIAKDGSVTSDTPLSWAGAPVRSNRMDLQSVNSPVVQNAKTYDVNYARRTEASRSDDYLTLISPQTVREGSSYRSFSHTPQESVSVKDKLADVQRGRHVDSLFMASNETPVRQRLDSSSWKAYELGSPQGQDIKHMAPEVQTLLPHSFTRTENDKEIKEKDFTKRDISTSRAIECRTVEDARTREQLYDYKLGAEVNLIKNNTNKETFSFSEKGVTRTEKVPMIGDIAALLEKDRQVLEAQRGNALVLGERFAHTEKGNAKQESLAMREKQCTQNEPFRKSEVFKIHPSDQVEVKRQNSYVPNEGLNIRQEYRRINHELYDAQENHCDNLAANKGLYPTREMKYTSNEAFGRKELAKQAVPVTRENKPVKNEFVVKEQDGVYLQGQVRQRIPSRTDDRNGSNYTSAVNQYDKTAQELSQRVSKDRHPNVEAFTTADHNPTKQVHPARKNLFTSEPANQVKHVPRSSSGVRYAPIEEFARKDRELEQQRLIAMVETKQEPVKVQALIKQYEVSMGENRSGAKGVFTTGETRIGGVQERYMSSMLSVTVAEQGKEKLPRAPLDSDITKDERGFHTQLSAPPEFERSGKHMQASKQSKYIQNEVHLHREMDVAPHREKGQTRQEMLTSKLKAHAEKEIFAIKGKGHAKLEAHATKPKELYVHVNKEGEPLSAEHVKNGTVPLYGDRLANQDSAAAKEARWRDGALVDQGTSSSVGHGKNVVIGDEENRLAKPAPTTREKEHARNYIVTKTERIGIRQEELQSIARAKIEAIAGSRVHQPKRASEESGSAHLTAPLNLSKNTESVMTAANVNVSQAEAGDAKKHDVPAVKEKEQVKMEALPQRQEQSQNLGPVVNEIHKAKNVLLNKEISSVSPVAALSLEHARNQTEKEAYLQAVGDILSRREREAEISNVHANKAASFIRPTAEHLENKTAENHGKHKDVTPVTIQKEHASNYLLVSKERVTLKQEVAPSIDHIRSSDAITNNETRLVREGIGAVEKDQAENETAALHANRQVKLGSLASGKSEGAENDAHGIQLRSAQEELSPVTNVKAEAVTESQRQESTHVPENKKRASVMHELPQSLEKENGVCETTAISDTPLAKPVATATRESEDDKNNALAKEERSSLKQEMPLLVQHRNKTFAVQEKDEFKRAEKEHAKTGVQGKEIGCSIQEEPSVEHIRIKIISHDKTHQVRESIIEIGNAKQETQIKPDCEQESEPAEPDRHGNAEGLGVKQEVLPPSSVKSEDVPISETLPAKQEPENRERDHIQLGISQSVEKEDMKKEVNAVNSRYVETNTGAVARREADEPAKKERIDVGDDEPPSVEHIRIKIIPHNADQPVREKIVSIENETVSLHENQPFKRDSSVSGKNKISETDALGIPERIRFKQEELPPITSTETFKQEERPPITSTETFKQEERPPITSTETFKQEERPPITSTETFKQEELPPITSTETFKQEELPPITSTETESTAVNQRHEATHEPVNKDRDTVVHELKNQNEKQIGTNETTAFNKNPLAEPEAVALRETEGDKSNEERMNDGQELLPPLGQVTHEATAEEEGHGDKRGIPVTGQKECAKSCAPVSKEKASFKQDEPSVKQNRFWIIPVDEYQQVRESIVVMEKEHSIRETVENLQVNLDSLAHRKHDSAGNTELGSTERVGVSKDGCPSQTTNETNTVNRNHHLENALERLCRTGLMSQFPTSTEKESIKNKTSEINEKRLPKPEVLTTRETKGAKADSPAQQKERINLGRDVPLSLECLHKENIEPRENHPLKLEVHDTGGKEHAKRDVNKDTDKSLNAEKKSDGLEELSSVVLIEAGVKASNKPKEELAWDRVGQEVPRPREDEPIKKGSVAKHKDKQEVLPTRKTELGEHVHALNKTESVKREEKERTQQETRFSENDYVAQGTLARRGEDSGSFAHANKVGVNAEDRLPSTPLNETVANVERHQAKHGLSKRDRENVAHELAPAGGTENPENKTSAVTEHRLARQEVKMTREGDAQNEALMNRGRDGAKVHSLPLKENEQAQNVRSVTDKIHQAVLADRSGNADSDLPLKIKRVLDRDMAGGEGHRHKRDGLSARERAHAQNEALLFDENLQIKLDALARRRKEKGGKYARANVDGTNMRRGEHASTPRAKTESLTGEKTHLAKHGLVIDDITRGISTRENENTRNVATAAGENPLAKVEVSVISNKEYGKKDTLVNSEAAGVRNRALVTRDREHGQNETPNAVNHRAKHLLESEPKGSITRAPLPSENIRNESTSASENAAREAFAMSKREDARNCGVANKVGDGAIGHQAEAGRDSVNHTAKQGMVETQVDSDRHGHTNAERTEERRDIIPPGEKENDKKQVIEKEKESVRMEKGEYAKWEVFPTKRSIVGKGELLNIAKGPTILDYLIEKDRDRSQHNKYTAKEKDTIKQEVHAAKDPTTKEVLVLDKKELIKNEGFACEGNTTVSNVETKDRVGGKDRERGGKDMGSFLPEVLVRKYEVPTENTFAVRDKPQTKQVTNEAAEPTKQELFSRKYHTLSENIKEHVTHKVLAARDLPKQEAAATRSSSKPEVVLAKEREPIRKETFEMKGKGAVDRLSRQHTDYIKAKECAERGRDRVRQEVPMEQYRNLSKNIFIMQDKDLSKQSEAHAMKDKEHSKGEIILSKGDAKQEILAKQGNVHDKPEVFPAHEKVPTNPEVYAVTDQAKHLSGKEALSPQRQGHYSKHTMLVTDERDNSHRRNIVPRGSGKMEMESLPNTLNEMKETPPLRENEREIAAMREYRAKERAVARQKQQYYDQEAHARQEYATYKTLPIKEKTDLRREAPAQFENENAKKEVRENNIKDGTEMAPANHPSHNIEGQSIHEPNSQYRAPSLPLQVNGWRGGGPVLSQQPGHINVPLRESYLTVGHAAQSPEEEYKGRPSSRSMHSQMAKSPEEEYKGRPSSRSMHSQMAKSPEERHVVEEAKRNMGKPGEALQYYAIINHERKTEAGDGEAASSQRQERMPRREESGLVHGELNDGGWAQGLMDYAKAHTPTPRSNASSPSLGKPVLFKVKDNTLRGSPVTKTVKPCFHKTLADDQRPSSSQENLSGVEKGDEECDRLKENVDVPVPVPRSAPAAPPRASRSREPPGQHSLPAADFTTARALQARSIRAAPEFAAARQQPAHNVVSTPEFISAREPRSYYRRSRHLEEDGRRSVVSTMSEDLESCATSATGVSAGVYMENPCERPESACSDVRALGKPPSVPPKSEKALRRAQRLNTRRIQKAEALVKAETLSQTERKPLRAVASMPSSPTEVLRSRQAVPAYQPAPPQFCVESGYAPHAPGLLAQPFPVTQRRLLQDPNSGQYFVVDMPVQVKTKMFFDPETGKYVQLSVRESPEGTRSNAPSSVEILSPPPYVLYPGFLPMPVSSLPPLRSTSQMSAPAALMDDQDKRSDAWRQEALRRKCNREAEPYIEPAYGSRGQPGEKPSYDVERGYTSPRNLNILPMSELEDFAMESA